MLMLHKWLDRPSGILLWIAVLAGFLMMLHVTADVFARYVLNRPFAGTNEVVSAYYMVAAAFLPWTWVARSDGHIMVELFTRKASARVVEWIDIFVRLLTAAYISLFTWQTALRALQRIQEGEAWQVGSGFIPVWPSRCLLPIAGGLMVLYLVLRVASDIAAMARR